MRFPRSLPIALSLLSVSASPLVQAQGARKSHEPEPPYVRVAPLKTPVKVDGRISPGEWDEAFMATGVATYRKGGVDPMPVRYRLAYDKAHLYLSAQMETPPGLKLDRPQRRLAKSEELLRFELLVDPKSNHPDASWVQGMFYPLGKVQNVGYNQRIGGLVPYHVAWDYRDHWENGVWTLEASAPLSAFGRANFDPGEIWGVLFAGVAHAGPGYFSGQMGDSFSARQRFLKMLPDASAPVIRIHGLDGVASGKASPEVEIAHPGKEAGRYRVDFEYRTAPSEEFAGSYDLSKPPVGTESVVLEVPSAGSAKAGWSVALPGNAKTDGWLMLRVSSEDGKAIFYSGSYKLGALRTPTWKEQKATEAPATVMAIHPYPYFGKLKVIADFGGLNDPGVVGKAVMTLKGPDGQVIDRSEIPAGATADLEALLSLPKEAAEGAYPVEVQLFLRNGEPLTGLASVYTHRRFAFEHNQLGVSDKVLPPWTPMKVNREEGVIEVWNRRYHLSPSGFPQQVQTRGESILAGPVVIEERVGGTTAPLKGEALEFTRTAEGQVEARAKAKGRVVEAEVALLAEYDGMLKYEVTLTGAKGARLEGLDLVIPLREEHAGFLHATGDGCRSNYAHAVPPGKGVVWDSTKVVNWVMPVQWLPYLWLGDTERGLCWWADSAEGWTLPDQPDAPVVKVERRDGEVRAVLHLVTPGSTVLWKDETPRRLVFALEATPVRPKVSWVRDIGLGDPKVTRQKGPQLAWIGSAHWATWEQEETPYSFAYLRPVNESAGEALRQRAAKAAQEGRDLLLYTDMRMRALVGAEEKAYAWEWNPLPDEPVAETIANAPHYRNIQVNATPSRVDYDLWCLNQLMDLGARAFYFDEIQSEGQINPVAGLGYRDEKGRWMPTMRLFAYRDLWKRLYTLMQERGIAEPVIILHNTSTTYAGPMAFATATWDFEEANSDPNARQLTKFGINYLIAEAMGHQYGFAASTLGPSPGFERWIRPGDTAAENHAARHWMGVHMVLDMNPYLRAHPVVLEGLKMLGEFGWSSSRWTPYWQAEKEHLYGIEPGAGARIYSAIYRRGNEGLLILLNDTNEEQTIRWSPGEKLPVRGSLLNAERKTETFSAEHGRYTIPIPRYDYRALRFSLE